MRLLRPTGVSALASRPFPSLASLLAPLLLLSLGCPAPAPIDDDDDDGSSSSLTTSTTAPASTSDSGTTETPSDDTTSTGADSTGASSSEGGNQGQECGNGLIEGTEQCDCGEDFCTPAGLDGAMCAGLTNPLFPDRVYTGGILDCSPASCQYVFAQCSFCGDTVLNGNEICELHDDPGPSCQALGMGSSTTPLPCGNDCQWDTTCCEVPLPKECM